MPTDPAKETEVDSAPLAEKIAAATESPVPKSAPDSSSPGDETTVPEPKQELLATVKERFGVDLTGKYTDDTALLAGLVNAEDLAHRRNAEAEFGREMQRLLDGREDDLREYLAGNTQPAKPVDTSVPFDPVEARRTQLVTNTDGELVAAPGAPSDIVPQYRRHEEKVREFVEKLYTESNGDLQKVMADQIRQQVQEETGHQTAAQQQTSALRQWEVENAELLYVNGNSADGYTPLGRKVVDLYESDPDLQDTAEGLPRLKVATRLARDQQPQTRASVPSKQSEREPDTAAALPDESPRKEGEGFSECLLRLHQARASTVA